MIGEDIRRNRDYYYRIPNDRNKLWDHN